MARISQADLKAVITKSDARSTKLLVDHAEDLGSRLKDAKLTTSQIRALFGEVRQIQAQLSIGEQERARALRKLILLKPKMAYRARRERGRGVEELTSVLDPAIDLVVDGSDQEIQEQNFQRFVDFFEAILAYHRAAGGN